MAAFLAQLTVNSIIAGSLYVILGLSFSIIYSTTGTFHFAHALVIAAAAYAAVVVTKFAGLPLLLGVVAAIVAGMAMGCCIELGIYRPLRRLGASRFAIFMASFGTLIAGQNIILILFKANLRTLPFPSANLSIGVVNFTNLHVVFVALAISVIWGFRWFLKSTRAGKATRAVASNPEMSEIVGIDVNRITILVYALGSGMAALAAMLITLEYSARPWMGIEFVFAALIVTFMGGVGSFAGLLLAAYVLALAQNFALLFITAEWKVIVSFIILLVVIVVRPQGLLPLGYRWRLPKWSS